VKVVEEGHPEGEESLERGTGCCTQQVLVVVGADPPVLLQLT
jgi:hypothetical protein